jgi:hypothetical protein
VSPWTIVTDDIGIPSSWATSCAIPVSLPEPGEVTPVSTVAWPDGFILTVVVSNAATNAPGTSAFSGISSNPIPIPSRRPSVSSRACSARSSV